MLYFHSQQKPHFSKGLQEYYNSPWCHSNYGSLQLTVFCQRKKKDTEAKSNFCFLPCYLTSEELEDKTGL